MDDLLKKYHLEEAQKRIMQLCEYSFKTGLAEADDEQNNPFMDNSQNNQDMGPGMSPDQGMDNQQGQGMGGPQGPDNGMGGPQGGPGMGSDNGMNDGGMDQGMGGPQGPGMGPDNGMGGPQGPDDSMGQDPTADMPPTDDSLPQGDEFPGPEEPQGDEMPPEDMEDEEAEDEDVIDVDDLTQSQEATEYKIDGVNDKISALLKVTTKFVDAIKDNERQIQDLRHEIERRNPTPEERMNIRSQSSYPYGETPRDYWDKKREENPNYNIIYDNDVSPKDEDKEFEIRREDLENLDKRSLADSLEFPKELRDYLDF